MTGSEDDLWAKVMSKGRTLEHGLTNRLYGTEIADIMQRFDMAAFQVQVWRDLATVARYKLYDALGMWLQSRPSVPAKTADQITVTGQDYLEEKLVPDYFARLRKEPLGKAPKLKVRVANYVTRGFSQLSEDVQHTAIAEFCRASLRKEDWFYSLAEGKFFAAENETGGYTIMLAEEY